MASVPYPEFKDLNIEQQKFLKEKKVTDVKTIDEWLVFFNPLALFDEKDDMIRRNGNYVKAFWSFWLLCGVYMGMLYTFAHVPLSGLIAPAGMILASSLLLVVTNLWLGKYETWDIPNLMREFLVPLLGHLQKRSGGDTEMDLRLDLDEINQLVEVEAEDYTTDKLNYIVASIKLPDSGLFNLTIDGMGVKQPYYSLYKLRHIVDISVSYEGDSYHVSGEKNSYQVIEKDNKITILDEYEEASVSPIESDTGPDMEVFLEKLDSMSRTVERKSI